MTDSDTMQFADESAVAPESAVPTPPAWKILIADDDEEVHAVTTLALRDFTFYSRPLEFLHAHSGAEAIEMMREHADVAIILMDVVMEHEHAGLNAVRVIRNELNRRFVRIVIRTGQPGQAPEHAVVTEYDINDYKEKYELTSSKLFTLVYTALSHYRELRAVDAHRAGLQKIVEASATLFEVRSLRRFTAGVLQQLSAVLYAEPDSALIHSSGAAASKTPDGRSLVITGTGRYAEAYDEAPEDVLCPEALKCVRQAFEKRESIFEGNSFAGYFSTSSGSETVLYVGSEMPIVIPDRRLIDLFCHNVARAYESLVLNQSMRDSQRHLVEMLSETIEERSPETFNHVRRVSAFVRLMGQLLGMPEEEADMIGVAMATHDVGKIAVPEAILNKPGRLTPDERQIMEQHVAKGAKMLSRLEGELVEAAAIIAAQHHERWDGKGYPAGLAGEDIHLYGRISALIDVFDALASKRCYKDSWSIEQVLAYIEEEKGRHFEPRLVELLVANIDQFLEVRQLVGEG